MRRLRGWKNLAPYKWRLLLLAALSCGEVVLRVLLPWPMKIVVDHALGALTIVPLLFAWSRCNPRRLRRPADRTPAVESRRSARLHESFSAIRLVKSFAREPYEGYRFAGAADDAMQARLVLSSREAW